jgi:hypothetical protein
VENERVSVFESRLGNGGVSNCSKQNVSGENHETI